MGASAYLPSGPHRRWSMTPCGLAVCRLWLRFAFFFHFLLLSWQQGPGRRPWTKHLTGIGLGKDGPSPLVVILRNCLSCLCPPEQVSFDTFLSRRLCCFCFDVDIYFLGP